jgi:hypothetical protein
MQIFDQRIPGPPLTTDRYERAVWCVGAVGVMAAQWNFLEASEQRALSVYLAGNMPHNEQGRERFLIEAARLADGAFLAVLFDQYHGWNISDIADRFDDLLMSWENAVLHATAHREAPCQR